MKRRQLATLFLGAAVAAAFLIGIVHQHAASRPGSVIAERARHQAEGERMGYARRPAKRPAPSPRPAPAAAPARPAEPPTSSSPPTADADFLQLGYSIILNATWAQRMEPASDKLPAEVQRMRTRFVTPKPLPKSPARTAIVGLTRAFATGDTEGGQALLTGLVEDSVEDPSFWSVTSMWDMKTFRVLRRGLLMKGEAGSDVSEALLLADTLGAPREVFAAALAQLLDAELSPEKRRWMAEQQSIEVQETIDRNVRGLTPRLSESSLVPAMGRWLSFKALTPLALSDAERFLDAWRRRDGAAMDAAEYSLAATTESMATDRLLITELFANPRDDGWNADQWQRAADCFTAERTPVRLHMACFIAAAILHQRDNGTWPQSSADLVPKYLPAAALDPASEWAVLLVADDGALPQPVFLRRGPTDPCSCLGLAAIAGAERSADAVALSALRAAPPALAHRLPRKASP